MLANLTPSLIFLVLCLCHEGVKLALTTNAIIINNEIRAGPATISLLIYIWRLLECSFMFNE